ncbi:MAG: hypothetical protein ORN54_10000 [Cyclobacteriaceae bacterium]|nr:hypothetical protein [Cyclobacteriaceae bacterium]
MNAEEFLAVAKQRYDALQKLSQMDSFYDYERQFADIWRELSREVLEGNLGAIPTNKRKKLHTFLRVTSMKN